MAVSFALFANRTGLVANAIGWPVLSVALAFLVFAGAGRGAWRKGNAGGWLAGGDLMQPVPRAQALYHVVQFELGRATSGARA